jgi:competence protein ComFC
MNRLLQWTDRLVGLVYPRNCLSCLTPMQETDPGVLCRFCLSTAPLIEPPFCQRCSLPFDGAVSGEFVCGYCADLPFEFERAVSAARAKALVRDCLHRFKYGREMYFARHLADWLIGAARQRIDWRELDAIVPVPLHPRKRRHREFNQAEILSEALQREFGAPLIRRNLRRVRDTDTQTALDAERRAANVRNAFAARRPAEFEGKRLALVDDVFTTGATLNSCARVLRGAGAARVVALTVARGV